MAFLENVSVSIFGKLVEPYLGYFVNLGDNVRRADMKINLQAYLSIVMFSALLAFIVAMIASSILISLAILGAGYTYTLSIIISAAVAGVTFFLGYYYPNIKIKGMKDQIEKGLPFASFYMTTTAASGGHPSDIFKTLSLRGGVIGKEARKIYTSVKSLGTPLPTALQRSAHRTPSPQFADLLWGMVAVIRSGGDLEQYLIGKTESLMASYRRRLNDYAKAITLYTEIYVTLIIVGSLFFLILIAIIAPLIGISVLFLQTFLVFFFIPLTSIAYIVLLKSISPIEG